MRQVTSFFIAFVAAVAVASPTRVTAQTVSVRQLMEGEQLFRSFCSACHGADGKGQGPAASALKTRPADLTSIAARNGGTFPGERIERYVANGDPEPSIAAHGSRDMPVWGPNFAALAPASYRRIDERIAAVVAYVRSIQAEKR
jgi:mono/diheme cytochrome c family protein